MSDKQNGQPSASSSTTNVKPDTVLQHYSLELLKCLDEMKYKRDTLHKQILTETKEKATLQEDLRLLTDRLTKMNESLCDKMVTMERFNQAISETERALSNLVVGSEHLLLFMKKITDKYLPEVRSPRKEAEKDEGGNTARKNNAKKGEGSTPRR